MATSTTPAVQDSARGKEARENGIKRFNEVYGSIKKVTRIVGPAWLGMFILAKIYGWL
jgi:hypothetical protein